MSEYLIDIEKLIPDPKNARKHSTKNKKAINSSLRQFGAARSIVLDKDGVVRAGNGTLAEAKALGYTHVRVVETSPDQLVAVVRPDWNAADAKAYGIADNRAGELAEWDGAALKETFAELDALNYDTSATGFNGADLAGVISDLNKSIMGDENAAIQDEEAEEIERQARSEVYQLRQDVVFDSTNKYGIPDLLPDKLCSVVPTDIWTGETLDSYDKMLFLFGTNRFPRDCKGGILGFYVDDYRFEGVWNEFIFAAKQIKKLPFQAIIEPDFSVWRDDPVVVQMYNRYRSQWVARYWQELGMDVIPSLNWSDEKSYEFAHAGIPKGCELVSLQCRTTKNVLGKKYFIKGFKEGLKQIDPKKVMIYGGLKHRSWIEPELDTKAEIFWLPDWASLRMERRKSHAKNN